MTRCVLTAVSTLVSNVKFSLPLLVSAHIIRDGSCTGIPELSYELNNSSCNMQSLPILEQFVQWFLSVSIVNLSWVTARYVTLVVSTQMRAKVVLVFIDSSRQPPRSESSGLSSTLSFEADVL